MLCKKWFLYIAVIVVVCSLFMVQAGCSKKDEQQTAETEEKDRIEQMTDQAADRAVKKIRTPIDKAQNTQEFGDDRLESMDKALQQQ